MEMKSEPFGPSYYCALSYNNASEFIPLWRSKDQGHFMTFGKGHISVVCQHIQRASPLKPLCLFPLNFILSLLSKEEKQDYIFLPDHMTKLAAILYIVKT